MQCYLMGSVFRCSKRRKGTHGGKGLRHFSMKVCEKVQKKGVTSYNEVADELVAEFTDPRNADLMVVRIFLNAIYHFEARCDLLC